MIRGRESGLMRLSLLICAVALPSVSASALPRTMEANQMRDAHVRSISACHHGANGVLITLSEVAEERARNAVGTPAEQFASKLLSRASRSTTDYVKRTFSTTIHGCAFLIPIFGG